MKYLRAVWRRIFNSGRNKATIDTSEFGTSLSGQEFSEEEARLLLEQAITETNVKFSEFSDAFHGEWTRNPPTSERVVLGFWIISAWRHLRAVVVLADSYDLNNVAEVHFRSILEIFLQVRYFIQTEKSKRERMAQKVSAWGCIDYLEKVEKLKGYKFAQAGYAMMNSHLANYDSELIKEIQAERKKNFYWFVSSFTTLATNVSKQGEDFAHVYKMTSAEAHGSWDVVLNVAEPEPGHLDFSGYPNRASLFVSGAESIDRTLRFFIKMWNEVAGDVGAEKVTQPEGGGNSPFTPQV